MNLSFAVYQSRSLFLMATSDRSWISDNGNNWIIIVNCYTSYTQKIKEIVQLCKSGKISFAISGYWVLVLTIPINRSYWNSCWLKPVQLIQREYSIWPQNISWFGHKIFLDKFTMDSSVEILLRRAFPALMRTSGFDSRLGHPRLLWSTTSTSSFDSSSGGISDFELQGLRLHLSSPSGFEACVGLHCALRRVLWVLAGKQGIWLVCWTSMPAWSRVSGQ